MAKIISLLLSVITVFSSFIYVDADEILSPSFFIENIDESDISSLGKNVGYIKNTALVFFDENATFFDKIGFLLKTDGSLLGFIDELDLCVIKTENKNYNELNSFCKDLTNYDSVALATICPAKKLENQYTPTDPFMDENSYGTNDWDDENPQGNNWHIEAIDARSAWGYKNLFSHIEIGVVDGGFDTEHEELKGKILFPTKRAERRNRPNHHGTHVAGIIAAEQDNGVGISGICSSSTLICVDWSPSTNQLWIADLAVLQALGEVVKKGAKVINFSVGNSSSMGDNNYKFPSIVPDIDSILYSYAFGSLLNKGYDFVVVQSAGNGNGNSYAVDASQNGLFASIRKERAFLPFNNVSVEDVLNRIIIVGSAEKTEAGYVQTSSSNIGDRVDICAPGYNIYSCTKDNTYLTKSGTSMAAPVVTGVASLVWSVNPALTGKEVKEIVCSNTKDVVLPAEERHYDFLNYKSYPLVNAKLAVEATLREMDGFCDVTFETTPKTEVVFENENQQQFIFESNSDGVVNCVLKAGTYTVDSIQTIRVSDN